MSEIPRLYSQPGSVVSGETTTLASAAYDRLKQDIRLGHFLPGTKLGIDMLMERYGVGRCPIREALNRLSSEAVVLQIDHRGFRVPPLSLEDLEELTNTRCWLYEIGIRESIKQATVEWEEGIVLTLHRLDKFKRTNADTGPGAESEQTHRAFHAVLISQCGSRWITNLAEQMFDLADRYRIISRLTSEKRDSSAEHHAIADAVLEHDTERAIAVMNIHFRRTAEITRQAGISHGLFSSGATRTSRPSSVRVMR